MILSRLLYYPVSYMECSGNAVKALECVPEFKDGEWHTVERDDLHDMFKIWHLVGDYK